MSATWVGWFRDRFDQILIAKNYWHDRQRIRSDPMIVIAKLPPLRTKPLRYAATGMLGPGIALAGALLLMKVFPGFPIRPIDRDMGELKGFKRPALEEIKSVSDAELNAKLAALYSQVSKICAKAVVIYNMQAIQCDQPETLDIRRFSDKPAFLDEALGLYGNCSPHPDQMLLGSFG